MTQLVLPYDIINNTAADAVPIEANYNVIAQHVNSQVINRDGGVAMNAPLLLVGDPTSVNHAANKGYVDTKATASDATAAAGDALKVSKTGDTMTGSLTFKAPNDDPIRLYKAVGTGWAYMSFYDEDQTTRRGWVGVNPNDDIALASDTGHVSLESANVCRLVGVNGTYLYNGLNIVTTGPGGYGLNVSTGPNYIHGGLTVFDGLNIASVSPGGYCLNVTTGPNYIHGGLNISEGLNVSSDGANINGGQFSVGTGSGGWIVMSCAGTGSIQLNSGPSGNIGINTGGVIALQVGGVQYGHFSVAETHLPTRLYVTADNSSWTHDHAHVEVRDGAGNVCHIAWWSGNIAAQIRASEAGGTRLDVVDSTGAVSSVITASAFAVISAADTKLDIADPDPGWSALAQVCHIDAPRVKRFRRPCPSTVAADVANDRVKFGLMAEDVAEMFPGIAMYGADGKPEGWDVVQMVAMLYGAAQELAERVTTLEDA